MELTVYLQPKRGGGVARHMSNMVQALSNRRDIDLTLCASSHSLKRVSHVAWAEDPRLVTHSMPEQLLERSWKMLAWPPADWFIKPTEWIYAAAEVRLPRCSSKTAIAVHDVQALETDLPWSNTPEHKLFQRKWKSWLAKMSRETDLISTGTEFSKNRIVELVGVPPSKVIVIGNGVEDVFFSAGKSEELIPERNDVLVIGGLRTKKGAKETLQVAAELMRLGSPIRIHAIGHQEQQWLEQAAKLPNVVIHGNLSDLEIAQRLTKSLALLFISHYEGFGIPAIEAMACGTPAIVSNCGSLPEVAGDAGIVVPVDDATGTAMRLESLRSNPQERQKIVDYGKQYASSFTWDRCAERLLTQLHQYDEQRV